MCQTPWFFLITDLIIPYHLKFLRIYEYFIKYLNLPKPVQVHHLKFCSFTDIMVPCCLFVCGTSIGLTGSNSSEIEITPCTKVSYLMIHIGCVSKSSCSGLKWGIPWPRPPINLWYYTGTNNDIKRWFNNGCLLFLGDQLIIHKTHLDLRIVMAIRI